MGWKLNYYKNITKNIGQITDYSNFNARGTGLSAIAVSELLCSQARYILLVLSIRVFAFCLSFNMMQSDGRYFLSFYSDSFWNLKVKKRLL